MIYILVKKTSGAHGEKVGNRVVTSHFESKACFTKRGLEKRTILHELGHHLVYINCLEVSGTREEKAANSCERFFLDEILSVSDRVANYIFTWCSF